MRPVLIRLRPTNELLDRPRPASEHSIGRLIRVGSPTETTRIASHENKQKQNFIIVMTDLAALRFMKACGFNLLVWVARLASSLRPLRGCVMCRGRVFRTDLYFSCGLGFVLAVWRIRFYSAPTTSLAHQREATGCIVSKLPCKQKQSGKTCNSRRL